MSFMGHGEEVSFHVCKTKKQPMELQVILIIDVEIKDINKWDLDDPTWKEGGYHAMM